jgi:beta-phosphoglucomutase-like phosphatase (HAD superfamily)
VPFDAIIWDLDDTNSGRHLMVVYEEIDADTVYPVTATTCQEAIMKRISRNRRLTPAEAAKYRAVRQQVEQELPELVERHHQRMAALDQLEELLKQLKAAREARGLSLADVTERTGMDRSALSKLETGQRANPTVETLVRYAEAVGKRLVVTLADA